MRLALALVGLLAACGHPSAQDSGVPRDASVDTAVIPDNEACTTKCLRPSDCAFSYPDDDRCPTGFRCARTFLGCQD